MIACKICCNGYSTLFVTLRLWPNSLDILSTELWRSIASVPILQLKINFFYFSTFYQRDHVLEKLFVPHKAGTKQIMKCYHGIMDHGMLQVWSWMHSVCYDCLLIKSFKHFCRLLEIPRTMNRNAAWSNKTIHAHLPSSLMLIKCFRPFTNSTSLHAGF